MKRRFNKTTQPKGDCAADLKEKGVGLLQISGLASTAVEAQVVRWREETGKKIDWHYIGGRALVLCYQEDLDLLRRHVEHFSVQVQRS